VRVRVMVRMILTVSLGKHKKRNAEYDNLFLY
jgi:hypothetical protein